MKKITPKIFFIFSLIFIIFFLSNVHAQAQDVGTNIKFGVETAKTKWDYLGEEWKNILLKNPIIFYINDFFMRISFIFVFLFGEPYSFSLTLFVIIILWIFLFFSFSRIFKDFTAFSSNTSKIIGLGITIILAQLQILRKVVESFGWVIFSPEAVWIRFIMFFIIIFLLVLLYRTISVLGKIYKTEKIRQEKEKEKIEKMTLTSVLRALLKGFENK